MGGQPKTDGIRRDETILPDLSSEARLRGR